jgi:YHS domain-containing protein
MSRKILFFTLAVCLSLFAAAYRWPDSAHSIGLIKNSGGGARHPSSLESGETSYTLIATATVMPPYHGDARVVLEGTPKLDYRIYSSGPVIDLGIRRQPVFRNNVLFDLRPGDRIALWVVITPPVLDPVCGMPYEKRFLKERVNGRDYYFCCEGCREAFMNNPSKYMGRESVRGAYSLAFYDTHTGKPVLWVPLKFTGKGEREDAAEHHH